MRLITNYSVPGNIWVVGCSFPFLFTQLATLFTRDPTDATESYFLVSSVHAPFLRRLFFFSHVAHCWTALLAPPRTNLNPPRKAFS